MELASLHLFLTVVFLSLLWWLLSYFVKLNRIREIVDIFPGPKPLPIIGNVMSLNVERSEFITVLSSYAKKWRRKFRFWLLGSPYVVLLHPETIAPILSSATLIDKSYEYKFIANIIGDGLNTLNGKAWKKRRKLLSPAFHFSTLDSFIPIFNQQAAIFISQLHQQVDKAFDIAPFCSRCALDIICEAAMGYQLNTQTDGNSDYANAIHTMQNHAVKRMLCPWLWPDWIFYPSSIGREHIHCAKLTRELSDKIICERKEEWKRKQNINLKESQTHKNDNNQEKQKVRPAFLDLLLDLTNGGEDMIASGLRDEVDTFMMAGHETTSSALGYTLLLLGCYPDIQRKVHEELDSIYGDDCEKPVTREAIGEMKYLDRVIKEQLRLFPIVPFLLRKVTEDIVIDEGVIPKGATAICSPYLMHRNPDVYPEPLVFNPDRFLPDNVQNRHPFAYIPFSGGQRNCIGQKFALLQLKILLAWVLRVFSVKSIKNGEEVKPIANITLSTKYGFPVILSLRKHAQF